MTTAQICMMASIVVYLFAMVLIGVAYSKKTKNARISTAHFGKAA